MLHFFYVRCSADTPTASVVPCWSIDTTRPKVGQGSTKSSGNYSTKCTNRCGTASGLSREKAARLGGKHRNTRDLPCCYRVAGERESLCVTSRSQTKHRPTQTHTSSFPPVFDPAHKKAGKERWQSWPPRATSQASASKARAPSAADRLPAAAQSPATRALALGLRILLAQ